jgi:hypothetical protein
MRYLMNDYKFSGRVCRLSVGQLVGLVCFLSAILRGDDQRPDLASVAEISALPTFSFVREKNEDSWKGIRLAESHVLTLSDPDLGPSAVYFSVLTPSPAMVSEQAGRSFAIWPNSRYYHSVRSRHPFISTIYEGKLFGRNPSVKGQAVSQEVYAGAYDLAQGPMTLRVGSGEVMITGIRIQPLDPEAYRLALYKNNPTANRRVIYNNDGFSLGFGVPGWDVRNFIDEQVKIFADSDAQQLDWGTLCTAVASYPSKAVDWFGDGVENWSREFERLAAENFRKLEAVGMPLYPTMVKVGREFGLPIWGSLNMSAYYGEHPFGQALNGKLYREHPEYRIKLKDGSFKGGRAEMSMAHPAVREQRLGVPVELAAMGCAGVNLDFCRYPEVLGYDDPLTKSFSELYGEDPRHLSDGDSRWMAHLAGFMNDYMRELRRRLNEVGRKRGESVKVSVRLPARDYRKYGLDPETWIKEGLVDILIPGYPGFERWFDPIPWVKMVAGTKVQIYPNIENFIHETKQSELTDEQVANGEKSGVQTKMTLEDYLRRAAEIYQAGGDGLNLFNNFGPGKPASLNHLGDKESVKRWSEFEDRLKLGSEIVILDQKTP